MRIAEAQALSFWYPYKNLAQLLEKSGRVAEAMACFRKAASLQSVGGGGDEGALRWYAIIAIMIMVYRLEGIEGKAEP